MSLISIFERPDRASLLYELLTERDETVNISHKAMPCWGDHVRFVESNPYRAWYFVMDEKPVGSCYLSKHNEIGVQIFKAHQGKGYGRQAVQAIISAHGPRRYLANINPHNERSKELFTGLGFKLIQHTYECV